MDLKEKINNRSAIIGVVGLGYIGLPLAIEFVQAGFDVIGIDSDENLVILDASIEDHINDMGDYLQDPYD